MLPSSWKYGWCCICAAWGPSRCKPSLAVFDSHVVKVHEGALSHWLTQLKQRLYRQRSWCLCSFAAGQQVRRASP